MALSLLLCLPFFIFCLFLRLSLIILHFSPPSCLSVRLGAVFNMLRGHMSTPNATEQIRYFVCIHSSFGPIRVLAFCYCHAWWGFLRCPTKGEKHVPGAVSWGSHLPSILLDFLQVYPVYVERGLRKNGDTVITFAPYFKDGGRKFWRVNLQSESGRNVPGRWVVGEVTSKSTVSLPTHILTYSCVCFHAPPPSKQSHALVYTGSQFNLSDQPHKVSVSCWSLNQPRRSRGGTWSRLQFHRWSCAVVGMSQLVSKV